MLVAQITDLHLGFEPDNPGELNRRRLDSVIAHLRALDRTPDILFATGDLIDKGDAASYRQLREALSDLPFPVHYALGNHDRRDTFAAVFPEARFAGGFLQYAVETPALRFLVLDTLEEGRHGGAFCAERAAWLAARLNEAPDRPTLIVMHHPPIDTGIAWMTTDPQEPWIQRLDQAMRGHDQIVGMLCGHIHRVVATRWRGHPLTVCPSSAPKVALTLAQIDPLRPDDRPMIVEDPAAFALHWWDGRALVSHFDIAESNAVLAAYDTRMQPLVERVIAERPGPPPALVA